MPNLLHTHERIVLQPVGSPSLNSVVDMTLVSSQESIHISKAPKKFSMSASLSIGICNFLPNVQAMASADENLTRSRETL